jgi:rubrerythrin
MHISNVLFAESEGLKMTAMFNAIDVFKIAEQIERNGARFYHKAAVIFDDVQISAMFLKLADWEAKHERIFSGMRQQLSEIVRESSTLSDEDTLPEAKMMAALAVFGIRPDPADELSGKENRVDVLNSAVEKEKDSIVFYNGLKDFAVDGNSRDKIDEIIKEELHHIDILNRWQKRKE